MILLEIHLCLLILVLLPLLHPPDPPPGQSGVLIAFGEPDAGESGGDIATAPPVIAEADPVEADEPDEPIKEETPKKDVEPPRQKKKPNKIKLPRRKQKLKESPTLKPPKQNGLLMPKLLKQINIEILDGLPEVTLEEEMGKSPVIKDKPTGIQTAKHWMELVQGMVCWEVGFQVERLSRNLELKTVLKILEPSM